MDGSELVARATKGEWRNRFAAPTKGRSNGPRQRSTVLLAVALLLPSLATVLAPTGPLVTSAQATETIPEMPAFQQAIIVSGVSGTTIGKRLWYAAGVSPTSLRFDWQVPSTVTSVDLFVFGGGGGGGGGTDVDRGGGGGGGGGGGEARRLDGQAVTPGEVLDLRVGWGGNRGAGNQSGADGQPSSVTRKSDNSTIVLSRGGAGGRRGGDGGHGGAGGSIGGIGVGGAVWNPGQAGVTGSSTTASPADVGQLNNSGDAGLFHGLRLAVGSGGGGGRESSAGSGGAFSSGGSWSNGSAAFTVPDGANRRAGGHGEGGDDAYPNFSNGTIYATPRSGSGGGGGGFVFSNAGVGGGDGSSGGIIIFYEFADLATNTMIPAHEVIMQGGDQTAITLQLRDAAGKDANVSAGPVTFAITSGVGTLSPVTDNNDGTYTATLTSGAVLGEIEVEARLGAGSHAFAQTASVTVAQFAIHAGEDQEAVAGEPVAVPPGVIVTDHAGDPVAGVEVTFAVTSGGGTVDPATAVDTDADGIATLGSWTLGTTAGANTLTASAGGLVGGTVTFTATGVAGPATALTSTVTADPVTLTADGEETSTSTLTVQLKDVHGNDLTASGGVVTFAAPGADQGSIGPVTDHDDGTYTATYTAGTLAGPVTIVPSLDGTPFTVTATITLVAGPATQVAIEAGDGQSAVVGEDVPVAPSVVVRDLFGNPVSGFAVTFAVASGDGTVVPTTAVTTGADGIAAVTSWTLGTTAAGENTLTATATGLDGSPVTFTATSTGRALTVLSGSFTVDDKVYDGTDDATIAEHDLVLTGFLPGDDPADVEWVPTARFTDLTAGADRTVELLGGAVLGGPRGAAYVLDVSDPDAPVTTATITRRPVTVTGASATARAYDGTTDVVVGGATLAGTVAGDAVSLAGATVGVAASRDAGTRAVATSMTLTGADADNYMLTGQPSLTVTITPRPATVTLGGVPPRVYDATNTVPVPATSITVSGLVAGESITASGTANIPFRDVGTRVLTLDPTYLPGPGTDLANYVLPTSLTGTVTITPRPVSVTGLRALGRPWDGTTTAVIEGGTLEGVLAGDRVTLAGTTGTFAAATAGTHRVVADVRLDGEDARNYRLAEVPQLSATITHAPATLRVTAGTVQYADGTPRTLRAIVVPAGVGRVVIGYPGGSAPSEPGTYQASVRLDSASHRAEALTVTMTVESIEAAGGPVGAPVGGPVGGPGTGPGGGAAGGAGGGDGGGSGRDVLSRLGLRPDGTRAFPEIGPLLDGSLPRISGPGAGGGLEGFVASMTRDSEAVEVRVYTPDGLTTVVEDDEHGVTLEVTTIGVAGTSLPIERLGTLSVERGGSVVVSGSGHLAGSTLEVWMFSQPELLGTTVVGEDERFRATFLVDAQTATGQHTLQVNGFGADDSVRSVSFELIVTEPTTAAPTRVRMVALFDGGVPTRPAWLLALAALLGAAVHRWWARRRDRDDAAPDERRLTSVGPEAD